jgi:phosphate starvation-inducible membrane PsiE
MLHAAAATLVVVLIFVQLYLIGEYVYGNASALKTHESVGKVVPFVELLVFLTALVGWWSNRWQVGLSFALFIVGGIQVSFATTHWGTAPSVRALHPALAVAVVLLAAVVASRTWRLRGSLPHDGLP